MYICSRTYFTGENQMEYLIELGAEPYEDSSGNEKFRIEFNDIKLFLKIIKILTDMAVPSEISVINEDRLYDYEEDFSYMRYEFIKDEYGQEFLNKIISALDIMKNTIVERRNFISDMLAEISYDYRILINLWNKYGKARLYINDETGKIGFIDLIYNYKFNENTEYSDLMEDIKNDQRIKVISNYFRLKEGYSKD